MKLIWNCLWSVAMILIMASCVTKQKQGNDAEGSVASILMPPKVLDDEWCRGLVGKWEWSGETDLGQFKNWLQDRGRMTAEMGLGGQFLIMKKEGHITALSDEYTRYLKQTQHASEQDVRRLRDLRAENLELYTTDPRTGEIVAYLFDRWRCVAKGTGKREGRREIIQWEWSVFGKGTSTRTTEKVGNDRLVIVERYATPDGITMEGRAQMTRKR